jgi:hypothetical protein
VPQPLRYVTQEISASIQVDTLTERKRQLQITKNEGIHAEKMCDFSSFRREGAKK